VRLLDSGGGQPLSILASSRHSRLLHGSRSSP
jgi:hypothetical protein